MNRYFDPPLHVLLAVLVVFVTALSIRLSGTDWDGWANLHPDERHMVFVTQDVLRAVEAAVAEHRGWWSMWFGPDSPFDPRAEGRLYVYGDLPLMSVSLIARATGATDWGSTLSLGRSITAVVESSSVIAVFILGLRLCGRPTAALAGAILAAMAPTSLQIANFYTVDAWLVALVTWAIVPMAALTGSRGTVWHAGAAGALAGVAAACKISAAALVFPALFVVWVVWRRRGLRLASRVLLVGFVSGLFVFRIANPSAFGGAGFWSLGPSSAMLADFAEVRAYMNDPGPPSNWYWLAGYSTTDLARDMMLFGTGPILMLMAFASLFRRKIEALHLLLLVCIAGHILFYGTSPIIALRYLAPIIPLAAILAASVFVALPAFLAVAAVSLAVWWGWGAVRLHDGAHPRLIATEWMRDLPPDTKIAFETGWDEGLPVWQTFPAAEWSAMPGPFIFVPLGLTDFDEADSPARIAAALDQADYVSISSGRVIEVMPRLPDRFPTVTNYYRALLGGQLCFERVLYLDRGYPLPLAPFDDGFAQEPWRVYDHPVVQIWKKLPCFDRLDAERLMAARD